MLKLNLKIQGNICKITIQKIIKYNKGNKLIGSYFGKEIVLYLPLLKWYLQQELVITKFHCAIKYKPEHASAFQKFADEVSDARKSW